MPGFNLDPPGLKPSTPHATPSVSRANSPASSRTMSASPQTIDLTTSDDAEPRPKGKERAYLVPPAEVVDSPSPSAAQAEYDMDDADIPDPTSEELAEENSDLLEYEIITKQEFLKHTRHDVATEVPNNHEITRYAPLPGNGRLEAGAHIELDDGDFLRVVYVVRNKALPRADLHAYTLRGILLRRQRRVDNMFDKDTNELIAIILIPMDDNRPHFVSGLEDRPLTSFVCFREIVFTNAISPQCSFRTLEGALEKYFDKVNGNGHTHFVLRGDKLLRAAAEARLVCRMKAVKRYILDGKKEKLVSNAFRRLLPEEADPRYSRATMELFKEWREPKEKNESEVYTVNRKPSDVSVASTSSRKRSADVIIIDDSDDDTAFDTPPSCKRSRLTSNSEQRRALEGVSRPRSAIPFSKLQKHSPQHPSSKTAHRSRKEYTVMDLFCGSGGVSEAARLAGLVVRYAVDNKKCAVRTHQKNHRRCTTIREDVSTFLGLMKPFEIIVDMIHSSNPCRYWSPNHTTPGQDDEINEAIAYTAQVAAQKILPRILTFEQTPGLCSMKQHRANWQLFMHQLTSIGFDVEWRVISFSDYGNSQARRRLIIFAACPGQELPEFPSPTYGKPGSGLKQYKTVNETISDIPRGVTFHNPDEMRERHRNKPRKLPPASGHLPLYHLVDTSGPHALHPNNKRQFTLREVLRLQGFSDTYQYASDTPGRLITHTEGLKMAGDAVPPKAFKPFMAECKKALERTDKMIAEYVPPPPIDIDSD